MEAFSPKPLRCCDYYSPFTSLYKPAGISRADNLSTSDRSKIVDPNGRLKKEFRPNSVNRVIKPVESLVREIIIHMMKQQQ